MAGRGSSPGSCILNCRFDKIKSDHLVSQLSEVNGEVTGAATKIEDRIWRRILFDQSSHRGLRRANIPGWDILIYSIEKGKWVRTKSVQVNLHVDFERIVPNDLDYLKANENPKPRNSLKNVPTRSDYTLAGRFLAANYAAFF